MKLHLERFAFGLDSTLGRLHVPGLEPCYVVEDEVREDGVADAPKVKGETAIPYGTYRVTLRTTGGFHARYAERFPGMHRGMLWLRDVPGFDYILVHCGNDDDDTAGCLLPGEAPNMTTAGEFEVYRSAEAYVRIYAPVASAIESGRDVRIEVTRRIIGGR